MTLNFKPEVTNKNTKFVSTGSKISFDPNSNGIYFVPSQVTETTTITKTPG